MKFYRVMIFLVSFSMLKTYGFGFGYQSKPEKIYSLRKITMSKEWYAGQANLWYNEIEKNRSDADAWFNYYQATRYAIRFGIPISSSSAIQQPEIIIRKMSDAVSESFEYHLLRETLLKNKGEKIQTVEKAYRMKPSDPRSYYSLISLYERTRQMNKMKAICRKLHESRDYPSSLFDYNYNVLISVETNGILFTNGDNDTYPVELLQQVNDIREDVVLFNIHEIQDLDYLRVKLKENDIHLDMDGFRKLDLEKLVEQIEKNCLQRKIYFAVTVDTRSFKSITEHLYCIGLVYQYSTKRIDNVALILKHIEKMYLLDYLHHDWYDEMSVSGGSSIGKLNTNYIYPLIMLVEHYELSGDVERAKSWKKLVQRLAEASGKKGLMDYLRKK